MKNMSREARVIDYDKIEEWSPWLDEFMASIGPKGLIDVLRSATPEYLEDARDHLVAAVGRDRLVDHLNHALEAYRVRVFHGTRVTLEELRSIAQHGLRALKLSDRRDALAVVFSQHPEWADKARLLGEELHRFGPLTAAATYVTPAAGSVSSSWRRAGWRLESTANAKSRAAASAAAAGSPFARPR